MVEIKLRISLSGSEKVESQIDDIGDSLDEMSRIDAKNAREAFNSLNGVKFSALKSQIQSIGNSIKSVGDSIQSFGTRATLAVSAPIAGLAILGVKFNAMKEQALVSFGVLLKSGDKAKVLFADLQKFAADTPFEMPEINQASKSLLAFGVAQEKIIPTLKSIGDIASGTGVPLSELSEIYGKAKVQGRLFAEDINQLTGRGIPIIQELAKQFGVSETEVKKLVESGKVGFPQLEKAFQDLTKEGGQFSGMMEAQSKTFSGRLSTLLDGLNTGLGNVTEPLFNALSYALPYVISFVETISNAFTNLSPTMKIVISVITGIAAALAPVLVVIGALITAFASVATALAPVISAVGAFLSLVGAAGLGATLSAIVSVVGGALVSAIGAALPVIAAIGAALAVFAVIATGIVAALVALYLAFQNNFGGIRDATIQAFNIVKSTIQTAMNFIYSAVVSIGGQIVGWWRDNYSQIQQIVETVSNGIKSFIQSFLDTVRGFWQDHGETITEYVKTYFGYIKEIITQVVSQVGKIIEFGLRVINGDWENAWKSLLDFLENGARLGVTIWRGFLATLGKLLAAIVPIALQYGGEFSTTIATWFGKAVVGAVYILATLPQRIISIIPKLVSAGMQIGKAIWEGIKEGLKGGTPSLSVDIPPIQQSSVEVVGAQGSIESANKAQSVLGGLNSEADKKRKEREALAQAELAAQINMYQNQISEVEKLYKDGFAKITEIFKESQNPEQYKESFHQLSTWYGGQINELVPEWENLVRQQTLAEKEGQYERLEVFQDVQKRKEELQKNINDLFKLRDKELAEYTKKLSADGLKDFETNTNRQIELRQARNTTDIKQIQADYNLKLATEAQFIAKQNQLELDSLTFKKEKLNELLKAFSGNAEKQNEIRHQIGLIDQQISQQQIDNSQRILDQKEKERLKQIELDNTYKSVLDGLDTQILELNKQISNSANLSEADAVAKLMQTEAYQKLTPEMQKTASAKAEEINLLRQQIDAQRQYNEAYNQTYDFIRNTFDILTDSGSSFGEKMKQIFGGILQSFKKILLDMAAAWLTSKIFGGGSSSGAGGGFSLGNIFQGIFGGGGSGGFGGISGTPGFNPNSFAGGGGNNNALSSLFGAGSAVGGLGSNPNNPFGLSNGGRAGGGSSNLAGILGLVGTGAGIIGQAVGGRFGGILSGAGSGLAMGAQIGSIIPGIGTAIGAGVGAIIGGLMGLFGGDPKRKKDKKENIPALNKGFADSFNELRQLVEDVRFFRTDPDSAISKGRELRSAIASGFGIKFESKKYKKESQKLIQQKLAEIDRVPDGLMDQLKKAAAEAKTAGDRTKRILPEFAGGTYFADYFKPNGLVPGMFDRKDDILAMISRGEMVLNPQQQARVRMNAGFDVFATANIPNYPKQQSARTPRFATGANLGTNVGNASSSTGIVIQPNFTLVLQGDVFDEKATAYLIGDNGKRTLVKVTNEAKKGGKIK